MDCTLPGSSVRGILQARVLEWDAIAFSVKVDRAYQRSPDSSVGKESNCNAGDPGSIPGLGRCTGEGIGYPLQYSRALLVAQMVENLPAMQETWI